MNVTLFNKALGLLAISKLIIYELIFFNLRFLLIITLKIVTFGSIKTVGFLAKNNKYSEDYFIVYTKQIETYIEQE